MGNSDESRAKLANGCVNSRQYSLLNLPIVYCDSTSNDCPFGFTKGDVMPVFIGKKVEDYKATCPAGQTAPGLKELKPNLYEILKEGFKPVKLSKFTFAKDSDTIIYDPKDDRVIRNSVKTYVCKSPETSPKIIKQRTSVPDYQIPIAVLALGYEPGLDIHIPQRGE